MVCERRMHFTKCSLLMQDLLAAKRDLRLSREIKRLGRFEGLIIDDLGTSSRAGMTWMWCSRYWRNVTSEAAC